MSEENGIALHIDRIDMLIFYANGKVTADTFSTADVIDWGDDPDIPAYGTYSMMGGTDYYNGQGEVNAAGAAIKMYCTDAGGNPLTFTAYVAFPQE